MRLGILFSAVCFLAVQVQAADWPAFRGPRGDGISSESRVPVRWGPDENITWKAPLAAGSNGSPIVSGGRVFVTCAEEDGLKRGLYCFDRHNGKQLWVRTVDFDKKMPTHQTNPHGSSTPVADGKRVVVWHSSAGLFCYDLEGELQWSRQLGEFRHQWGYGSSPVLHKGRVILHCGPGEREFMTAIDLSDGKTIWETDEPTDGNGQERADGKYMGSWSMPIIARIDGRDQIVCTMPTRVNAYDPDSGDILWSCEGIRGPKGDLAYSSPLIDNGFCVATGGFGGPAIGFRVGGKGDVTAERRAWRADSNPQSIGSGVLLNGHVFKPNAGRPFGLQCLKADTGEIVWEEGKTDVFWGSIVKAGDNLYATNQRGETVVFKANPEKYEEVARNQLNERCNATPAISNGQIFIRTYQNLYCIGD